MNTTSVVDVTSHNCEKLNSLFKQESNITRLHPMQPLNVICQEEETVDSVIAEEEETFEEIEICKECQIPRYVGNCKGCGIYQYCISEEEFDITIKRRRH